jgi:hypothetical protein
MAAAEGEAGAVIVRCTKRLLDLLGGPRLATAQAEPGEDDWYANLLWVDGKKCLLLTHAGTLFSVFLAEVRKGDLVPFGPFVVEVVAAELRAERLPADALGALDPAAVELATTASRRVLGLMNDIAVYCRHAVAAEGGLRHTDIPALNHSLRRTLNNHGGYAYPIERVAERLAARPQTDNPLPADGSLAPTCEDGVVAATATTIDKALESFLAEQRKRLSAKTLRTYEDVVQLLRDSLNGYAYDSLPKAEQDRWQTAFDGGDEEAYCHLFGPNKIAEHLDGFLGWFMIRKVMASTELLRASGTVTKKLAAWLHEQGYVAAEQRDEAAERGTRASRELPDADRLGSLLHDTMRDTPPFDVDDIPEEHWIEDLLAIERVEPGKLWFESGIGPVQVSQEVSALARVGWSVNVVLAQWRGHWHIVELGYVYP